MMLMMKHGSVGKKVIDMGERICFKCNTEMLEISSDGKEVEGYLCFVCGKEVKS